MKILFNMDREIAFLSLRRGSTYIAEISPTQWELCVPAFGNSYCIVRMIPCRPLGANTCQFEFTEGPENFAIYTAPTQNEPSQIPYQSRQARPIQHSSGRRKSLESTT